MMKTNVKPGMLARVVRNGAAVVTPGILDRIVEVVRLAHSGDLFRTIDGVFLPFEGGDDELCWVVRSKAPLPCMCFRLYDGYGPTYLFNERPISDFYLRPIGGVPVDEEITDEVTA